ncbi:hypothetical protein [Klebsiella pneumoniae]|uniref:hypothetical protein n=1 Tax=Klebsiella pneumoniae TaxID=573 RepID=UPI001784E264|nr:hypothetical protein [Klebsiella pneumoniae]
MSYFGYAAAHHKALNMPLANASGAIRSGAAGGSASARVEHNVTQQLKRVAPARLSLSRPRATIAIVACIPRSAVNLQYKPAKSPSASSIAVT